MRQRAGPAAASHVRETRFAGGKGGPLPARRKNRGKAGDGDPAVAKRQECFYNRNAGIIALAPLPEDSVQ